MTDTTALNLTNTADASQPDGWITLLLTTSIALYVSIPVLTEIIKSIRLWLTARLPEEYRHKAQLCVKQAFSDDPSILADHGIVRAPLLINYKTGEVGTNLVGRDVEQFDIVFGSGASLDDPLKGINPNGTYISDTKIGELTADFTEDVVECFNNLWASLFAYAPTASGSAVADARFDTSRPETYKASHAALVRLIAQCRKSDSQALPPATDTIVQDLLRSYIDSLLTLVRFHLGTTKAFEVRAAMEGGPRWNDPNPKTFLELCTANIYTKPAALVRDFSQIIGWQPVGGFVIDADSPYQTQIGVACTMAQHVPRLGEGVLSLCEGLQLDWSGVEDGHWASEPSLINSTPLSIHWRNTNETPTSPPGSSALPGTVLSCEAKHVGVELAQELVACKRLPGNLPHDQLVTSLKDPYVVKLTLAAGADNRPVEVRYGNVHFSSSCPDAQGVVAPAISTMASMYNLHAVGGDTNVTASKEINGLDVDLLADRIKAAHPNSIVRTFPHSITKTRRAGDILRNAQTLTKYGTICERDGMIAIAF